MIIRSVFGNSLRFCSVGGSAIDPQLLQYFKDAKIDIYQGYGSTECSPMISLNSAYANKMGSVGKILDCNKVKINEDGELLVAGTNVANGYLNNKDDTNFVRNTFDELWYKTGDSATIDDEGYLFVTGRIKEQYKLTNGKFVNPSDVEQILLQIPEIDQTMVFGNGDEHNTAIVVTNSTQKQINTTINKIKHKFNSHEFPKKIIVINEPFTVENDMLTQKQSLKRNNILNYIKGHFKD